MVTVEEEEEQPQLSAETFSALAEFYKEQEEREQQQQEARTLAASGEDIDWKEDWQLSQFWYVVFSYWDQLFYSQSHHISMCFVPNVSSYQSDLIAGTVRRPQPAWPGP